MSAGDALDASLRDATVMDRDGYGYLVHPLCDGVPRCPPALLAEWVDWAARQTEAGSCDVIVAPEAMALPLAAGLALRIGKPYLVVRKRAYGLPGERSFAAKTGYGASTFHLNGVRPGERVLIVDDILSTGATLTALVRELRAAGAVVAGALLVLDKATDDPVPDVAWRAMRRVRVAAGRVEVLTPRLSPTDADS